MIEFGCCEVHKAMKSLYSDNEVLSISPIIKASGEPFENDSKVIYYGMFANPSETNFLYYQGKGVKNDELALFDKVLNPFYDNFHGYEVRLKNTVQALHDPEILTFNISYLDNLPYHKIYINYGLVEQLEVQDGFQLPLSLVPNNFIYLELNEPEPELLKVNGINAGTDEQLNESHFIAVDGSNDYEINIAVYDTEVSP